MGRLTIATIRSDQVAATAGALARAFDDDPVTVHLLPQPAVRAKTLRAHFRATLLDALPFSQAWGVFDDGRSVGASIWYPPGAWPMSLSRNLRLVAGIATRAALGAVRAAPDAIRFFRESERVHLEEPHWYLSTLGVHPALQGKGGGGRVLEPALARCDDDHQPAYLETGKERNIAWYARHGFELVEELRPLRDGPPLWTMLRPARG